MPVVKHQKAQRNSQGLCCDAQNAVRLPAAGALDCYRRHHSRYVCPLLLVAASQLIPEHRATCQFDAYALSLRERQICQLSNLANARVRLDVGLDGCDAKWLV